MTSKRPSSWVAAKGSLATCWCSLFGKYESSVRPLIVQLPVPGTMRTRATASLRRPVAAAGAMVAGLSGESADGADS
jgi:hypothetical protein